MSMLLKLKTQKVRKNEEFRVDFASKDRVPAFLFTKF